MKKIGCLFFSFVTFMTCGAFGLPAAQADLKIKMMLKAVALPPGFEISLYAADLPDARSMCMSPSGVLFVGTRKVGRVYAVLDRDGDFMAEQTVTIAEGLDTPNGVAFWDGDLYVAEVNRILRYSKIEANLDNPPKPEVVFDGFPKERDHGWRFIRFGPDGRLYVSVGAPCNVCQSNDPIYATIARLNRDGGGLEIFAHGVRNTAGFDWSPRTGELWFTDNGREWLGDDQPPDELNHAPMLGIHFGFPFCHGGVLADPDFGGETSCAQYTPPALHLEPHAAAMGMRFYSGTRFPSTYHGQIFIAEHGSWDRGAKTGCRVSVVHVVNNKAVRYEPFAQGWMIGETVWGRPVDVEVARDGGLLVSDDKNGVIYRISYAVP